jgi:hypothetical protein
VFGEHLTIPHENTQGLEHVNRSYTSKQADNTFKKNAHLLSGLFLDLDDLAKHDNGGTFEDGDAAETFASLEAFASERLHGVEVACSHFVGFEKRGVFELGTTGGLANFPVDLGEFDSRASSTDEGNGTVTDLELPGVIEDLHLSGELANNLEGRIRLLHHNVTDAGHVDLVKTLNVETNVVTGVGDRVVLVVHFDGENLTFAGQVAGVSGHEAHLVVGLDDTLFDTAGDDITNTLDLVHARNGHAGGFGGVTDRGLDHVIEAVEESVNVDLGAVLADNIATLPPGHLVGLGDEVVADPAGDREEGNRLLDEVFLPANLHEGGGHLSLNLVVTVLFVAGNIGVHLVDTDNDLLDTQKVDKTGVLASLTLNNTLFVVTTLDSGGEVTIGGDHDEGNIGLRSTGNHVLDEISVAGCVNDGVVVLGGKELLGGAGDGDTAGTLFLGAVHVEGKSERVLAEGLGLILELLHFTLGDTAVVKNQTAGGGRFTGVDVTADDNRYVDFISRHG